MTEVSSDKVPSQTRPPKEVAGGDTSAEGSGRTGAALIISRMPLVTRMAVIVSLVVGVTVMPTKMSQNLQH